MSHTSPLLIGPHQQHRRPTGSEQVYYMGWDSLVQGRLQCGMKLLLKHSFFGAACQI